MNCVATNTTLITNQKKDSSTPSEVKPKIGKTIQNGISYVSSVFGKITSISKLSGIITKVIKFVQVVFGEDQFPVLHLIKMPVKAVKNITSTLKVADKTKNILALNKQTPLLRIAHKVLSFVTSILKTVKYFGSLGILNLGKAAEALGRIPVFGIVSKIPLGIVVNIFQFVVSVLGAIEDAVEIFSMGKKIDVQKSSINKWSQRNSDIENILRAVKDEIKLQELRVEQDKKISASKDAMEAAANDNGKLAIELPKQNQMNMNELMEANYAFNEGEANKTEQPPVPVNTTERRNVTAETALRRNVAEDIVVGSAPDKLTKSIDKSLAKELSQEVMDRLPQFRENIKGPSFDRFPSNEMQGSIQSSSPDSFALESIPDLKEQARLFEQSEKIKPELEIVPKKGVKGRSDSWNKGIETKKILSTQAQIFEKIQSEKRLIDQIKSGILSIPKEVDDSEKAAELPSDLNLKIKPDTQGRNKDKEQIDELEKKQASSSIEEISEPLSSVDKVSKLPIEEKPSDLQIRMSDSIDAFQEDPVKARWYMPGVDNGAYPIGEDVAILNDPPLRLSEYIEEMDQLKKKIDKQRDLIAFKRESLSGHYRSNIEKAKLKMETLDEQKEVDKQQLNQLNAKVIKWEKIIDIIKNNNVQELLSLTEQFEAKILDKHSHIEIIKKARIQRILSLVYRVAKIVLAASSIFLFFTGIGSIPVVAGFVALNVLTYSFGIFKFFWQETHTLTEENKQKLLNFKTKQTNSVEERNEEANKRDLPVAKPRRKKRNPKYRENRNLLMPMAKLQA